MIHINKDYISTENTYQGQNAPKYIVVHETDNFAAGANAERHASAQAAGHLSTSVHYYCGSDGVCQAARHSDGTYSVGREYGGEPFRKGRHKPQHGQHRNLRQQRRGLCESPPERHRACKVPDEGDRDSRREGHSPL